jgi:hypothetical protein
MKTTTLKAGTLLYHGTDCDDFDEVNDRLTGPAWLSTAAAVALHFAKRSGGWGGTKRVMTYRLTEDVELPEILSERARRDFAEEHNIDLTGVEEMRDSVERAGIPGWVVPNNYPDGDDILLVDTGVLEHVRTEFAGTNEEFYQLLEKVTAELRIERLKLNCDYAVTYKYGQANAMCQAVFEDTLREVFDRHRLPLVNVLTYQ